VAVNVDPTRENSKEEYSRARDGLETQIRGLKIQYWHIERVRPNPRSLRKHSAKQIVQIAASIGNLGFRDPILVSASGEVVAGTGRLIAAQSMGLKIVPVIVADDMTPEELRIYAITTNRLAELSEWDLSALAIELQELEALSIDFDLNITGFDSVDRDGILGANEEEEEKEIIEPGVGSAVSNVGDIWKLGPHCLLCGSALDPDAYVYLLRGERAQMVFTDPPYNVRISSISGLGRVRHPEFEMGSGEMSDQEFVGFLTDAMTNAIYHSEPTAVHFLCTDWRHIPHFVQAAGPLYGAWKNMCVWVKTNAGMGSFYRSQHEEILVFTVGKSGHINNFGLGERGRHRTNAWHYDGMSGFHEGRDEALGMHPTVKPLLMVADAIRDCSHRGGIILDPFGGSGTTLLAAEKTGRVAYLIELDPRYIDVTIRRWQKTTGQDAILVETGETFDDREARLRDVPMASTGRDQEGASDASPLPVKRTPRGTRRHD
jgi:DNA modification methylase